MAICYQHDTFMEDNTRRLSNFGIGLNKAIEKELKSSSMDEFGQLVICDKALLGKCYNCCQYLHHSCPYLWEIKAFGKWIWLKKDCRDIEKEFVKPQKKQYRFIMDADGESYEVIIIFLSLGNVMGYLRNWSNIDDLNKEETSIPVRRLSTESCVQTRCSRPNVYHTYWQWYWEENENTWQPYLTEQLQMMIEAKYLHNQRSYIFEFNNQFYELNFATSTQTNIITKKTRSICRRPHPTSFEEISKRFHLSKEMFQYVPDNFYKIPSHWSFLDTAHEFELVILEPHDREYIKVDEQFFKTMNREKYKLHSVYRVQNQILHSKYSSMRECMLLQSNQKKEGITVEEKELFHGTDGMEAALGICVNNFDCRISGKHGTVFGKGSYFARDAKISAKFTALKGPRTMFLASVLVGSMCKGAASYTRPPVRKGRSLYDCCVDNTDKPEIYVIFDWSQCYPSYLIWYDEAKSKSNVPP